jgi:hypothetical protein
MPETAIDEDRNFPTGKRDVRDTTRFGEHQMIDTVSQADSMYLASQGDFCARVLLSYASHAMTGLRRGGRGANHFRP